MPPAPMTTWPQIASTLIRVLCFVCLSNGSCLHDFYFSICIMPLYTAQRIFHSYFLDFLSTTRVYVLMMRNPDKIQIFSWFQVVMATALCTQPRITHTPIRESRYTLQKSIHRNFLISHNISPSQHFKAARILWRLQSTLKYAPRPPCLNVHR